MLFLRVSQSKDLTNLLVSSIEENTQCHKLLDQWLLQSSSSPWIICTISSISFNFPQSIVDGRCPKRIACCFQNSIVLYIVEAYGPVISPNRYITVVIITGKWVINQAWGLLAWYWPVYFFGMFMTQGQGKQTHTQKRMRPLSSHLMILTKQVLPN